MSNEFYKEANTGTAWDHVNKRILIPDREHGGWMYGDGTKPPPDLFKEKE